jgi:predicted transglutaminase-like protease
MGEYKKRNIKYALEGNLNAHNTFYQAFIALGLVGFLILLITLFMPLVVSIKTKDYLYVSFLLIIMFNFCFESMLETQAGVMFYAFFNSLFCFKKTKKNQILTTNYR